MWIVQFALMILVCALVACAPRVVGVGTVEGGNPAAERVRVQVVAFDSQAGRPAHIVDSASASTTETVQNTRARLEVVEERNPATLPITFHLVALSSTPPAPVLGMEFVGDGAAFVRARVGSFVHLTRRQDQTAAAASFGAAATDSRRVGIATMARIRDGARDVPWEILPGDGRPCLPAVESVEGQPADCFDVESLSRRLLVAIATRIEPRVRKLPTLRALDHRLHFIPHMVHAGLEAAGLRARGFGLIYSTTVQGLAFSVRVYAPLSVLFHSADNVLRMSIDPVSSEITIGGTTVPWENGGRIAVEAGGPMGALAGPISDAVRSGLAEAELPPFQVGPFTLAAEEMLALAFNAVFGLPQSAGSQFVRVPEDFDALLLPDGEAGSNTLHRLPTATSDPVQVTRARIVLLR
jgi:hypothetical protein